MVKRILTTLLVSLACAALLIVAAYMAIGPALAVLVAIVTGGIVGIVTVVEYFDYRNEELAQELMDKRLPPEGSAPVPIFFGEVIIGENGEVVSNLHPENLPDDIPDELRMLLGLDTPAGEEPQISKLLRELAQRTDGDSGGVIEPIRDCEGKIVDFEVRPDHGLSSSELKEVDEKWGT